MVTSWPASLVKQGSVRTVSNVSSRIVIFIGLLLEESSAGRCQRDAQWLTLDVDSGDQAGVDGILPHRQAWTGGAPCLHHLTVVTRFGREPGQEVDRQRGKDLGHGCLLR